MSSNFRLALGLLCSVWSGSLLADFLDSYTTTAGTVGGQLSVSSTGSASYTIPIALPAGAGGVKPQISLVYNSQAAQGTAGIGWSLDAADAITKCPSTIAQDGVIDPVGSVPLIRTHLKEATMAQRSVHVQAKSIQFRVQA